MVCTNKCATETEKPHEHLWRLNWEYRRSFKANSI
uniref:ASL1 fusion protein n=1 Tax=Mus musculus TaxID=10090 RepID=C6EQH7_MOUSE|nr:ASL1 fusion protein [Mus musculus]